MITPKYASAHKDFWETADRWEAVRLHAAVVQGPLGTGENVDGDITPAPIKRRDIVIDVVKLLADDSFRDSVCNALASFQPRCDLVVVPSHGASEVLLDLARSIYPNPKTVFLERRNRAELVEKLRGSRRILILDDAVVSGTTVRSIHRMIQDIIHQWPVEERDPSYTISVFVVIGRPQSEAAWKRLEDSLRQDNERSYLGCHTKLLIPDGQCPWCDERSRLRRAQANISPPIVAGSPDTDTRVEGDITVSEYVEERLRRLNPRQDARITGLAHSIFLCGADGEYESNDTLTSHSLFGEALHEATAYAAVACAMHTIRVEQNLAVQGQQGTAWHWDIVRIITAYHDPIIQAAFLRAAQPPELLLPNEGELLEAVREAFYLTEDPDRQVSLMLAAEHKWAVMAQKHVGRSRVAFSRRADEIIALQNYGEHALQSARLSRVLSGLEAALLLPVRPISPAPTNT